LGWTADIALSAEQMMLSISAERNFKEWMRSVRKVMRESGAIPCYIPTAGNGFDWGAGPAWDQALVIVPYYVWLYRGDEEILKENAGAIHRYLRYIDSRRDERGLIHIGLGDWAPAARANAGHFQAPLEFTDTAICMDIWVRVMNWI
jgi:alpha-L-rhamnosidase